jgi:hypothetical protein
MYILVDAKTRIIIGTAVRPISEEACSKNGQRIYEIDNKEFSYSMIGAKLEDFEVVEQE